MADYAKQFAFVKKCDDAERLRLVMTRARKENATELANAAFRKLISLGSAHVPGSLENDFWTTIVAFEEILTEERGRTTRLARTRQKVAKVGIVQTLSDWALGPKTEGYKMLSERNLLDLSGEAIVLRHREYFDEIVIDAARKRLGPDPS